MFISCLTSTKTLLFHINSNWCQQLELNQRHIDFQSTALPTELCRQKGGSLTILLLISLVRLSRIREFKQPSNRVRCHIANLNYARLQGTQSYRLSQNWHPLKDSNLGMSESKSDALDQLGEEGILFLIKRLLVHIT